MNNHGELRPVPPPRRQKINELLLEFAKNRQRYAKNKNDVVIREYVNENDTRNWHEDKKKNIVCNIDELRPFEIELEIANEDKKEVLIVQEITRLDGALDIITKDSNKIIKKYQDDELEVNNPISIPPNKNYGFQIQTLDTLQGGIYNCAIHFRCTRKIDRLQKDFSIVREITIRVGDFSHIIVRTDGETDDSPFKNEFWVASQTFKMANSNSKNLKSHKKWDQFIIPQYLKNFVFGVEPLCRVKVSKMDSIQKQEFFNFEEAAAHGVSMKNYSDYFKLLLYYDEHEATEMISKYNMSDVTLIEEPQLPRHFRLNIPGLAEKRPSVLKGDKIYVRSHNNCEYEAIVFKVEEENVVIRGFCEAFFQSRIYRSKVSVRFVSSRYPYLVQHRAVDAIKNSDLPDIENLLFPQKPTKNRPELLSRQQISKIEFFNDKIKTNKMQKQAVLSVLSASSLPAPYIIFGPPGTGKTVTMVEAILQVMEHFRESHILVCTPSNAAADEIAKRLMPFLEKIHNDPNPSVYRKYMLRIIADSRTDCEIDATIKNVTVTTSDIQKNNRLISSKIIVTTIINASRFKDFMVKFSHVFIDEAGQAAEPESIVPITGLLENQRLKSPNGLLVLVGDHKQLGPICSSFNAGNHGLSKSLMERLMENPLYQNHGNGYPAQFITKLITNFRSHPDIIKIPNSLFYENVLVCEGKFDKLSDYPLKDSAGKSSTRSIIFHSVVFQEQREGLSPSFFNLGELHQVTNYLRQLFSKRCKVPVKQEEIGIISPYIRQVFKIRKMLEKNGWQQVEVGTTEVFQGREKRVIIISCVRSQYKFLVTDQKFRLGFVKDAKRFNVLMTRAEAKMIIIGNPVLLAMDPNWRAIIVDAKNNNGYLGCNVPLRDEEWEEKMIPRLENIEKTSGTNRN